MFFYEKINIFNNIVYLNDYCGIQLGSWSTPGFSGSHPVRHIKIINNTFYKNGEFAVIVDNPDAVDIVIRNNICSENGEPIAIEQIKRGGTVNHNLVIGDPLFINTDLYDFHLQRFSPAIDRGSSVDAPEEDFDGKIRADGSGFDIGAFEY